MLNKQIDEEKKLALTWYCFAVGSNVDIIDDISFNIETNEVMITEKNQKASVIVEEGSVKIVCSSQNQYNVNSRKVDDLERSDYDIYRVDKVIELVKNGEEVLWDEVTVERNGRGLKNSPQKSLTVLDTGKLGFESFLFTGETEFPPILSIEQALELSNEDVSRLSRPSTLESTIFSPFLKNIAFTSKTYKVDSNYDFRSGITVFKGVVDYKIGYSALTSLRDRIGNKK